MATYTPPTASTISLLANGGSWSTSNYYSLESPGQDTNTGRFYELYGTSGNISAIGHGFELRQGTDGSGNVTTTLYTNTSDNNADPDKVSVDSGTPAVSVVLPQTVTGQVIKLFNNSDVVNPIMSFTLTSAMLWTSSGGGIVTNSIDPLIENLVFTKTSDSAVSYTFDWENLPNGYRLVKNSTHQTMALPSTDGTGQTVSVTQLVDGDKLILLDHNSQDCVSGIGSSSTPYVFKLVEWSHTSTTVTAKCFGNSNLYYNMGGTGGSISGSYTLYDGNLITMTRSKQKGRFTYQVHQRTNPTGSDSDYGSSYTTGSGKVFHNFW